MGGGIAVPARWDHTKHLSKVQEIFFCISLMPFHTLFRSHVNKYQSCTCCKKDLGDFDGCLFTPVLTVYWGVISGVEWRCKTVCVNSYNHKNRSTVKLRSLSLNIWNQNSNEGWSLKSVYLVSGHWNLRSCFFFFSFFQAAEPLFVHRDTKLIGLWGKSKLVTLQLCDWYKMKPI